MLQIRHLLKRTPAALSGGQRQRVALGRALIREPRVFLMDEPLSNLDAALRVQMRSELIRLHQRLEETTIVYVTHDQVEALTMGDRVAVLKDGLLLQVDSANDLYEYPGSVFVGEFIGSPRMNIVAAPSSFPAGRSPWTLWACAQMSPTAYAGRLVDGVVSGPVLVGIRPHDLHLAFGAANESPRIRASVDVSEHTGTEVFATVDVGDLHVIARLPRAPIPAPGDKVELVFDMDSIHLFDPESKLSLLGRHRLRERVTVESSQQP